MIYILFIIFYIVQIHLGNNSIRSDYVHYKSILHNKPTHCYSQAVNNRNVMPRNSDLTKLIPAHCRITFISSCIALLILLSGCSLLSATYFKIFLIDFHNACFIVYLFIEIVPSATSGGFFSFIKILLLIFMASKHKASAAHARIIKCSPKSQTGIPEFITYDSIIFLSHQ